MTKNELITENKRLETWVNDLQSGMYINCVYCGHRYGPKDKVACSMRDVLKQHIEKCPVHPLSAAKKQIAALTAENERLRKEIKEIKEKIKLTNEYVDKYHGLAGGRSLEDSIKVEREIALNQSETQWLNR